jgi:hypothetical protein
MNSLHYIQQSCNTLGRTPQRCLRSPLCPRWYTQRFVPILKPRRSSVNRASLPYETALGRSCPSLNRERSEFARGYSTPWRENGLCEIRAAYPGKQGLRLQNAAVPLGLLPVLYSTDVECKQAVPGRQSPMELAGP